MAQASKRFFDHSVCGDSLYTSVRDKPHLRWGRRYTETLWRLYEPYADSDFLIKAPREFHRRFWEMYLGVALLRTRLPMKTKKEMRDNAGPGFADDEGPDFSVEIALS